MTDFQSFYKILGNIITKKELEDIEITNDTYDQYICNRYLSFYHPVLLEIINMGLNRQNYIPNGDEAVSSYLYTKSVVPKLPFKRIEYHKKKNSEKIQNFNITEEDILLLAQKKEMSVREIKEILKFV
jgi:hypothetical protein